MDKSTNTGKSTARVSALISAVRKALAVIKALWVEAFAFPDDNVVQESSWRRDEIEVGTSGIRDGRFERQMQVFAKLRELGTEAEDLRYNDGRFRARKDYISGSEVDFARLTLDLEIFSASTRLEQVYVERDLLGHPWFLDRFLDGEFGDDLNVAIRENGVLCPNISQKFVKAYPA